MNRPDGFTLIEVLIAMLVLAVGLLGLAGLQVSSLRNNQSAYNRSQATHLAYNLADRIRANYIEANKLATSAYITIDPTTAAIQESCNTPPGCIPELMAENDLFEWNAVVIATLPSGVGTIDEAGGLFTITINWDDNRDGDVDGDGGASEGDLNNDGNTDDDPFFQTSFQL